jgi:predicted nucleic acid-binding protein
MNIDRNTLVFFDASCLIAAAGSPSGGSSFLLSLCARGFIRGVISQPVLLEPQRNIQGKLGSEAISTFYRFLVVVPFVLAPLPPKLELENYEKLVSKKDAHVVAAANAIRAHLLLTLDKRLALQVNHTNLDLQALSPGEFINGILPYHTDYPHANN